MRLFRRSRDKELAEELRAHLEMEVAQRIARGESPAEAEVHARRQFGNVTHVAEVTREMWGGMWLDRLVRDLRYAARGLARLCGRRGAAGSRARRPDQRQSLARALQRRQDGARPAHDARRRVTPDRGRAAGELRLSLAD